MNVKIQNDVFRAGLYITIGNEGDFTGPTFKTDSADYIGKNGAEKFIDYIGAGEIAPEILHPYRGGRHTVLYNEEYYDLGKRSQLTAFCEELQKGGVIDEIYH